MRRVAVFLFLIMLIASGLEAQETRDRFLKGVELYNNGDFRAASEIWTELNNAGYDNFELLFNLGNAWFKLNEMPLAILFYERALLRRPGDEDARYNLAIANTLITDRFESIPHIFIVRWFDRVSLAMPSDSWAVVSAITFIMTLLLFLLFLFLSGYKLKVLSFWFSLLLFMTSAASLTFSFRSRKLVYNNSEAIIVTPVLTGRSTPSEGGNELFVIHAGLKVKCGEKIGEWTEIQLPDGNKGWVTVNSIEKI
jgi:tetratricopeptide (TPR) repeat protein